jgi:hypothetical protein
MFEMLSRNVPMLHCNACVDRTIGSIQGKCSSGHIVLLPSDARSVLHMLQVQAAPSAA